MREKSIKNQRLEKQIHRLLAQTLSAQVDDEILKHVSFTGVNLANDKSNLTVYVDCADFQIQPVAIKRLNQASGLFKSVLASKLSIYQIPAIKFVHDNVIEQANKIENLIARELKKINNQNEE